MSQQTGRRTSMAKPTTPMNPGRTKLSMVLLASEVADNQNSQRFGGLRVA
jgi:hypothetical protein